MSIERKTFKYMHKHIYTPKRLSPQKILALRHKTAVKEKLTRLMGIIFFILLLAGSFTAVLASVSSDRQLAKDCAIEKSMLENHPLKQPFKLLVDECRAKDLW